MKKNEELIQSFVKSAQYIDENYISGDVNEHNKHAKNITKIAKQLDKGNNLDQLKPLLNHSTNYVRIIAAYHLLRTDEENAIKVFKDIIVKNIPFLSSNAKISLEQWEENKKQLKDEDFK